ncbi:hypothetical protein [Tumebacillus permanentifrigoris]|uniref:Uncharacterized protein n=1 Tax=Tumebacillus permanentifrigoris TaxID=378543 RepID=A0A316DCR1_9BACL|nr:hypothetical protein [Tumebacillus permanentifrigoris]PWK14293.1 hypothetical protein C7459_10547 [Tumebacillus permanentifrigoris]
MDQRRRLTYEERFLKSYERLEKPLSRIVLLGFVLIVVAQVLLAFPSGRHLLSLTDRLEGTRQSGGVMPTAAQSDEPTQVTITNVDQQQAWPNIWVKLNGVPVVNFMKSEVTVPVKEGDVLTLDSSSVEGVFRFQIDHNSPHISFPVPGTLVESNQDRAAEVGPIHLMK